MPPLAAPPCAWGQRTALGWIRGSVSEATRRLLTPPNVAGDTSAAARIPAELHTSPSIFLSCWLQSGSDRPHSPTTTSTAAGERAAMAGSLSRGISMPPAHHTGATTAPHACALHAGTLRVGLPLAVPAAAPIMASAATWRAMQGQGHAAAIRPCAACPSSPTQAKRHPCARGACGR